MVTNGNDSHNYFEVLRPNGLTMGKGTHTGLFFGAKVGDKRVLDIVASYNANRKEEGSTLPPIVLWSVGKVTWVGCWIATTDKHLSDCLGCDLIGPMMIDLEELPKCFSLSVMRTRESLCEFMAHQAFETLIARTFLMVGLGDYGA